jgi:UDP-N-acetylmuramoyl-L-alanyl-D-glutamate--2,6-diaminopimelate ligase
MQEQEKKSIQSLLADWEAAITNSSHPQPPAYNGPAVLLTGFVEHTDHVEAGKCFVARVRATSDGHAYIPQAIAKGASLILGQRPPAELDIDLGNTPYLQVADTAVALAWLSAAWYGFPGRELVMIGVTGTDGKTTTTNLIYHILKAAGIQAGMVSTVYAALGDSDEPLELHVTTPEAPVVQRYLRRMLDAGLTHCVLETTSHALAQYRVDAIDFDLAVVTNITHEHLDYHGDYAGYLAAKSRLFESLARGDWGLEINSPHKMAVTKTAVLNRDDQSYEPLSRIPAPTHLTYGLHQPADVSATDIVYGAAETRFTLHLPDKKTNPKSQIPNPKSEITVSSSLVGEFNVYNMLAAATAAQALGIEAEAIAQGIGAVKGISGRMERIDRGQLFLVIVDFAHTPNALTKAIAATRRLTNGRIITVFGSAGKRDVAKRRLMAEIGMREADLVVLTAEDPRTESLDAILEMMADGCRSQGGIEGVTFWRVPDRGRAIYHALKLAQIEDVVLICGKGHEQSMAFGTTEYPWDDRQATRAALDAFLAGRPIPDLGLPTYQEKN